MLSTVIENKRVSVEVGSIVEHGGSGQCYPLLASDWPRADFYIGAGGMWDYRKPHEWTHAIRLEITGRTFQYRGGAYWVRVRLIYLGDGAERDQYAGAWLRVDPWSLPRVEPAG